MKWNDCVLVRVWVCNDCVYLCTTGLSVRTQNFCTQINKIEKFFPFILRRAAANHPRSPILYILSLLQYSTYIFRFFFVCTMVNGCALSSNI